jgi:hypothetical protein
MKRAIILSCLLALAAWAQPPAVNAGDDVPKVALILTPEQKEDIARQWEEAYAAGGYEVTLVFTAEQTEAIKLVCPACTATSITCSPDCVLGGTALLYFDDDGGVSAEAMPYRNR